MSKKNDHKKHKNVINLPPKSTPTHCLSCQKSAVRMDFCDEHFLWFKEGLLNKKGKKPRDFHIKYKLFLKKHPKAA